uniref:CTP synthase n=1 Tax=Oryza sativa subsp. japonica TaxID=39947 RepID=Q6AUM6_ORYSJ|nr:putative CTP synthase [Oryza sativa Japonica Group]
MHIAARTAGAGIVRLGGLHARRRAACLVRTCATRFRRLRRAAAPPNRTIIVALCRRELYGRGSEPNSSPIVLRLIKGLAAGLRFKRRSLALRLPTQGRETMKYVVVMGGVISGLGKGVTASSIGVVLKACGLRVTSIKIGVFESPPNIASPNMRHNSLADWLMHPYFNADAGTISPHEHGEVFVLDDGGEADLDLGNYERFLDIKLTRDHSITAGKIHHVIPHITNEIQDWIERVAIVPVDGEVDPADVCIIELGGTIGAGNLCVVHVGLVPVLNVVGEQDQKAHEAILKVLNLESVAGEPNLEEWTARADLYDTLQETVRIAMVGKYTGVSDTYLSVMKGADGILVPGGFGERGVEGKILAVKYARENDVPFLGICLGMQLTAVEFARHVLKLPDANSTEFDAKTENPCVTIMPEYKANNSISFSAPTKERVVPCDVDQRGYFSRLQVNPNMVQLFENSGLQVVGTDKTGERVQIVEIPNHRFFVGVQFHPEFKSRPSKPSALFVGLIAASCGQLDDALQDAACNHEPQQNRRGEKRLAASDLGDGTCRSKRQVKACSNSNDTDEAQDVTTC